MEGEARSRKSDFGREKHGPISVRKRSFQEKKVKSESLTYSASGSIGERSLDGMIVVGKGCNFMKSRSLESGHYLHEYHSETAIRPVTTEAKLKENVPNEGLEIGLPAYQAVSTTSFASAKSDISNADALQKKIHEMENEISGKNAVIARLKREIGKEGNYDLNSTSVETELTFEIMEDYENKLKDLKKFVSDRDKKITELTLKLEETVKAKSLQAEENKGLTHEINLLNRQLQSMHELIHSQHWEKNGDPKEVAKYKTRITELEFTLSKQDALLKELHRTIEKHDFLLKSKEKELKSKNQELSDYKSKSDVEIRKLLDQIDSLEKDSSKSKKILEYDESIQKISTLPKDVIDKIVKLCETGEINVVKKYADQRDNFERKLSTIREEHDNEIKRLTGIHDSKLNFLKKEIELLNEQLRERNAMLETYENELSLYRSNPNQAAKSEDLDSLKELFNAEIVSQKQIHKLEMDLFEEKVKRLSEDILYRAKNEEIHLQELQSAKASANSFREKYENLLEKWEETTKTKPLEGTFVDEMDLDDIVDQFKKLTMTLKQAEEIHQEKVKHLQNLHEDDIGMYQKEIDLFRMKLEQVDRFQARQVELDDEVKELIRNVEINFTKTVQSMTKNHEVELKLKQTEIDALERRYLDEINDLKEKQEIEVKELENKWKDLKNPEETSESHSEEFTSLKHQIEELTVELLKCEGTIAMKEEIENALSDRVKELEDLIQFKEDNCRKELEDLMSKYMKVQTLLSAKEEIAKELEDKLKETENLLEKSRSETEELDRTCVKLKENIQKVEMEKNELRVHFLEENSNDQHDPVDHSSSKISIDCQVDIPRVDSLETLQYMMRVGELEKENEDLKNEIEQLKNDVIELDVEKDFMLEKVKSKSSIHDEISNKFKNIQEELEDLLSQKNVLLSTIKSLEEERQKLFAEIKNLREENESMREKLKSNDHDFDLRTELKEQNEKLNLQVKSLTEKLNKFNAENERLVLELERYRKSNQELKNDLEEAWTQRCEVEDQLLEVRKENTLLNLTKNQLESTNKRISNLVSEGTPSVVSWLKIHKTVENIVDEVLALKTSFCGENNSGKNNLAKTKSELKLLAESLNLQLENKTKLCEELSVQKKSLEKELKMLEELWLQSEHNFLDLKSKYESELRNRNLALRKLELELRNKQLLETPREKRLDQKIKISIGDEELERIRLSTEETYVITKKRLKKHFEEEQKSREAKVKEALSKEIKLLKKEIKRLEDEIRVKDDALSDKTDVEKQELDVLRAKYQKEIDHLTEEHKTELEKLRSILERVQETGNSSLIIHKMEEEHAKAMEELRTYYEKKCADLEKQFSEEVYRQQSRKMSICSSVSESDFPTDLDSTDTINQLFEQIENKKKEQILENYRNLFEEEESFDEKKKKLENFLQELLNSHNKELNYLHVKYNKEISNLEAKHTSEMNRINVELSETRKNIEIEKQIFEINLGKELKKNLTDAIQVEFRGKLDHEKNGKRDDRSEEELNRGSDGESSKSFEMEQLVNFYRSLYETALMKFEQRQEQAIKNQKEIIEDYEKQIEELKETHRNELQQQICDETSKWEKFRMRERELESELSSIKSTYEDELLELRKNCQDTLREQVSLAKADAFNSLQQQIQDFFEREDTGDPISKELMELEEKFAGKYRKEIDELKQKHNGEVMRIRSEYEDKINRRYSTGSMPKRMSLNDIKTDDDKLEIIRERDALKDTVGNLRDVLSEFVRYINICEDELNNTLAEKTIYKEIVFDKDYLKDELNITSAAGKGEETRYKSIMFDKDNLNDTDCSIISKRVHFAPDLTAILSQMNESSMLNASLQIRFELDKCLKQLKNDANCLLALSNPSKKGSENINGVLKKLEVEKKSLEEKVCAVEEMHKVLRKEVNQTKEKVLEWERNREVVTEGFGEEVVSPQKLKTLSELKKKAKSLMVEQCNQPSSIMNFLEDICKEGDRLQEESRKEKLDLQEQVEAADKQVRLYKKFLDEQAAEREQERDDYINEIRKLEDALKVKERDSSLQERTNKEVEALESQLKETQARLLESEEAKISYKRKSEEANEKIWNLREIITDLEKQVASSSQREVILEERIKDLEDVIEQQSNDNQMIVTELDSLKSQTQTEMADYVQNLEKEIIDLRRLTEQTTPEVISQMKCSLREIESALARKTKDLEQLLASSANVSCSSPSEDVSIREHLDATRCPTPDEMHCHEETRGSLLMDEIDRVHEKLTKHTRAEEVAVKNIRDLEMQLKNIRKTLEEVQTERDALLDRVEIYLQENSSLKARLDEQRCNAGVIQRQLSADLESQIKRLEVDIEKLNHLCLQKDKQLRDMGAILEQTKKSLQMRETEVLNKSKEENALITRLKTDLQNSLTEKAELEEKLKKLSEKMSENKRDNATIPVLLDAMLEEKNAEIDQLKKELVRLSGQRAASSLINGKSLMDSANSSRSRRVKFSEPNSFVDEVISPILNDNVSSMRSGSDSYADLKISSQRLYKPLLCYSTPESLSSIGPLQLSPRGMEPSRQNGWNHHQKASTPMFETPPTNEEVASLKKELQEKTEELRKCERQLSERKTTLDSEMGKIMKDASSFMKTVEEDKHVFKKEYEIMLEKEAKLLSEIDSKRREISEQLLQIDTLREDVVKANEECDDLRAKYNKEIAEKNEEIENLKMKCNELEKAIELNTEEKKELKNQLNFEKNRIEKALKEISILQSKKVEIEEEFFSLKNDYNGKINAEQKLCSKLKAETADLHKKNLELADNFSKIKDELETSVNQYDKLSRDFASELSNVRDENKKLKADYLNLQRDLQTYLEKSKTKMEVGVQIESEKTDESCQTYENVEMALVPLKKYEECDEFNQFQETIQRLRHEINAWEEKLNEDEWKKDEALSYLALIRTLLTSVVDNLDDHFCELQTYRKKMMECSVDDLTDRVQRELMLSAKLDNELLSNIQAMKSAEMLDDLSEKGNNMIVPKQQGNFVNITLKISELEANLQDAIDKNNDLQSRVLDVKSENEELKNRVEKQKNFIKLLEDTLSKEKKKLAVEKSRYDEDAKIMEILRVNFENGIKKIEKLEEELRNERKQRKLLEEQVKASDDVHSDFESRAISDLKRQLDSERQKVISLGINVEKEKRKCQELRATLEREKLERLSEKDVQRLMGSDLALLQEQKENLENQLSNAREMLKTRGEEIASLKRKISLMEIDIKALAASNEHQSGKDSEQSMMADKIRGLEQELDFYRSEVYALAEKPERQVPSPLLINKIKNLSSCVQQHVMESNEMGEALLHLTHETEQMKSLIRKLEESTEHNSVKSADDTLLADTDMERKSWMMEKERLQSELEAVRNEYEALKQSSMETFKSHDLLKFEYKKLNKQLENLQKDLAIRETSDNSNLIETRIVHLFGKYMRAESYRKALAWQKRYLMIVISSYEESEEDTWFKLNKLAGKRKEFKKLNFVKTKRRSLKGVAMTFVAIHRMQYMVKRWRTGRLAGIPAILSRLEVAPFKISTRM